MKKGLMFAFAVAALFASCTGNNANTSEAVTEGEELVVLSDSTECVKSGDVVYIDLDAMFKSSKIFAAEGKPLEAKVEAFQKKMVEKQEELTQLGQSLAYEESRIGQESNKLQSDYSKGLITTMNAQAKSQELEKRAQNLQANAAAYQQKLSVYCGRGAVCHRIRGFLFVLRRKLVRRTGGISFRRPVAAGAATPRSFKAQ